MGRSKKTWALLLSTAILTSAFTPAVLAEEEHEPVTLTIVHEHSEEAAANIPSSAAFRYCMEKYKEDHP